MSVLSERYEPIMSEEARRGFAELEKRNSELEEKYNNIFKTKNYDHLNIKQKRMLGQCVENYYGVNLQDRALLERKLAENKSIMEARIQEAKKHGLSEAKIQEMTQTGDMAKYEPVLVEPISRVLPNLFGTNIFGLQPMSSPAQLIFYKRPVYSNSHNTPVKFANSKIITLASTTGFTVGGNICTNGIGAGVGKVLFIDVEQPVMLVQILSGSFAAGDSVDNSDTYVSESTTVSLVLPNEAQYRKIFKDYARIGDVATSETIGYDMKEMSMIIDKITVEAESYRLMTNWTDEAQQDYNKQFNRDLMEEIHKMIGDEFALETNRRCLAYALDKAKQSTVPTWINKPKAYGGSSYGRYEFEVTMEFVNKINILANSIVSTAMVGRGNYIVTSLNVAATLMMTKFFTHSSGMVTQIQDVDISKNIFVGTLCGYLKVYVDWYAPTDYIMVGYRGSVEVDNPFFYCPYIMLYNKQVVDPITSQNRMFYHTRYGLAENPFGAKNYLRYMEVEL